MPSEELHHRGLAGPVLSDQGVDLAGAELESAAVEGVNAGEALADVAHLDEEIIHDAYPLAWTPFDGSGPVNQAPGGTDDAASRPPARTTRAPSRTHSL